MTTVTKPFRVKKRIQVDIINFAVIRDGGKSAYGVSDTEGEAVAVCATLNTPPVAIIVPEGINPRSVGGSAA